LRLFSFGGYGLALAALALVVFGAYDSNPNYSHKHSQKLESKKKNDKTKLMRLRQVITV